MTAGPAALPGPRRGSDAETRKTRVAQATAGGRGADLGQGVEGI